MTQTIDQWSAEQCGVEFPDYLDDGWCIYEDTVILWTIKDPRCREIFRDWWLSKDTSNAVLFFCDEVTYFRDYAYGQGDPTTRDTEESCITAIYEAQK